MKVQVTFTLDVGDEAYEDVVSYYIYQYEADWQHLAEEPTPDECAEAVEHVLAAVIAAAMEETEPLQGWQIESVQSAALEEVPE